MNATRIKTELRMRRTHIGAALILTIGVVIGVFAVTDTAFADDCINCFLDCFNEWSAMDDASDQYQDDHHEFRQCIRAALDWYRNCLGDCAETCDV